MTDENDKLNEEIINEFLMTKINDKYDERICEICGKIKRHSEFHFRGRHYDILEALNKARQQGYEKAVKAENERIINGIRNEIPHTPEENDFKERLFEKLRE